jgi:hypothetical protein
VLEGDGIKLTSLSTATTTEVENVEVTQGAATESTESTIESKGVPTETNSTNKGTLSKEMTAIPDLARRDP